MKKSEPVKANKNKAYSATEVGAMLENIDTNVRLLAESHGALDKRLERVEVEVHGNSRRLDTLEIAVGISNDRIGHLENKVSLLDNKVSKLDDKVAKLDNRVTKLDDKLTKLDGKVDKMDKDLKNEIHKLGDRLITVESHR